MKIAIAICLTLLCLTSVRAREINGQVFIVTKGADSIKLGLVEVRALPADAMAKAIQKVDEELKTDRKNSSKAENAIRVALEKVRATTAEAEEAWTKSTYNDPHYEELQKKWEALSKIENDLSDVYSLAVTRRRFLFSSKPYFSALPAAVARAKTDADGNFVIDVPWVGDAVIAARATREVGDTTEIYAWIVTTDPNGAPKLALSNDNLSSSGSANSLIHTGDDTNAESIPVEEIRQKALALSDRIDAISNPPNEAASARYTAGPHQTVMQHRVPLWTPKGEINIPAGAVVDVVKREGERVKISYIGYTTTVPIEVTDLASR